MKKKKKLTTSNIINVLLIAFALLIVFVPSAKAFLISGLIQVGVLRPEQPNEVPLAVQEVSFRSIDGKSVTLSQLRGKVVFINFWATWCPPCIAEMPTIQKLKNIYASNEDVVFLLVDVDNKPEKAKEFMNSRKFTLPIYTATSSIPDILFKGPLPTTSVLNKEGKIVYHGEGAANYANKKFVAMMDKLVKE